MDDQMNVRGLPGGTDGGDFPHQCPAFPDAGATKLQCACITQVCETNGKVCMSAQCNSHQRRCFMCLALGESPAKFVHSPDSGMCAMHEAEIALADARLSRKVLPRSKETEKPSEIEKSVATTTPSLVLEPESAVAKGPPPVPAPVPDDPADIAGGASDTEMSKAPDEDDLVIACAVQQVSKLNSSQAAILKLAGRGKDNDHIAKELGFTPGTVAVNFSAMYKKLGLTELSKFRKRPMAVAVARRAFVEEGRES